LNDIINDVTTLSIDEQQSSLLFKEARMNFDKEKDVEQDLNMPCYGRR